jgi:hypothetical protein
MGKRLALLAIRLLVSVNLLYAAIFLKFAGVPDSVTLFTQMSQAVHGLVSQPVFRLGGVRNGDGGSAPDPEDSQIGSEIDRCLDDCRNSQSHFRVGIWLVLCRCSHGDGAGGHLSPTDTQSLSLGRTRKCGDAGCLTNAQEIGGRIAGRGGTRS